MQLGSTAAKRQESPSRFRDITALAEARLYGSRSWQEIWEEHVLSVVGGREPGRGTAHRLQPFAWRCLACVQRGSLREMGGNGREEQRGIACVAEVFFRVSSTASLSWQRSHVLLERRTALPTWQGWLVEGRMMMMTCRAVRTAQTTGRSGHVDEGGRANAMLWWREL